MTTAEELAALKAANHKLQALVYSLAMRVSAQAELLAKAARSRPVPPHVGELLAALAPIADVLLLTGWDDGALPASALYPVPLGDIRRAARVVAKYREQGRVESRAA